VTVLNSFKLKLVAYFALLSLLPMAAAFWGFTTVAGESATRQVDARLQAGLRAALAAYQGRVDGEESAARELARLRTFQVALAQRDRLTLTRLLRDAPDIVVRAPGGFLVGHEPPRGVSQTVDVVTRNGYLGTVEGILPLDQSLVTALRASSGLGPSDALALVDSGRIVASQPFVQGRVPLAPGRTATIQVGGDRYRTLVAPELAGADGITFAVLSPQSLIAAADATIRNRLLIGLLASLALVSLVAYVEGRSIVRTLRALAQAAHGIARGRLGERVPVRGRDEFAVLGGAFNEMAEQLEQRLAELEEERRRAAGAVARFGSALAATHDTEQLLRVVAEAAAESTGAEGVRVVLEDGAAAGVGDPAARGAQIELPLAVGDETLGSLVIVGGPFDEQQRATAASLASHAAVAIENARLHRIVERQALVDGLTGVANRRACEEALHTEVARAARLQTPFALVLADLDDFKSVNDLHGHAVGDEVLRAFAAILRETVRESDVAGRWGGEEFMVLLPGADGDGAVQFAERVRHALAVRPTAGADGSPIKVTCSFGVAERAKGVDADALYSAADRALYRAKREGKDRIEREPLVRSF
jgi:diguanylate cyclase (GGDEF)-like protein